MIYIIYIIIKDNDSCTYNIVETFLFLKIFNIFSIGSLEGKIVWITGASSGIGENLAYILAKAGCKLILSSRKETKLEKVKTNCLQSKIFI